MMRATAISTLLATSLALLLAGCDEPALQTPSDGGVPMFGLTAEQSARVLAKVGDKVITLGDFARTLERMDQFDRLRFQTKERRRDLLGEIVDVELLALEAKRRGLDKEPATADAIRQVLRESMLAQMRQGLPAPAEIPAQQVREYYDAHLDKFTEPERRRLSVIVMSDKGAAEKVLKEAQKAGTGSAWGELVVKHSLLAPKEKGANAPLDLAGDIGIVGPPSDARGANPQVPEPVRALAFQLSGVGVVGDELVEVKDRFYIVRISGVTAGHQRTLTEAERSIRVAILQQKMQDQDRALEEELRRKFPVEINEAALGAVKLPPQLIVDPPAATTPATSAQPGAAPVAPPHAAAAPSGNGGR